MKLNGILRLGTLTARIFRSPANSVSSECSYGKWINPLAPDKSNRAISCSFIEDNRQLGKLFSIYVNRQVLDQIPGEIRGWYDAENRAESRLLAYERELVETGEDVAAWQHKL